MLKKECADGPDFDNVYDTHFTRFRNFLILVSFLFLFLKIFEFLVQGFCF